MKIPFVSFKPMEKELDKELRSAFERVYTNSWYIEGKEDEAFEKAFAEYCTAEYCIGCGNGLDALMLSLKALGIKSGDEVIVPSNTYIATALAVTYVGAKPVFAEPDIRTYNIDASKIEEKITAKTKAIMLSQRLSFLKRMSKPHISANYTVITYLGTSAENCCSGINYNIITYVRMSLYTFYK